MVGGGGGYFNVRNLEKLICSKGSILRKQDTNWLAVAMYKLNLRIFNLILSFMPNIANSMFQRYLFHVSEKN